MLHKYLPLIILIYHQQHSTESKHQIVLCLSEKYAISESTWQDEFLSETDE